MACKIYYVWKRDNACARGGSITNFTLVSCASTECAGRDSKCWPLSANICHTLPNHNRTIGEHTRGLPNIHWCVPNSVGDHRLRLALALPPSNRQLSFTIGFIVKASGPLFVSEQWIRPLYVRYSLPVCLVTKSGHWTGRWSQRRQKSFPYRHKPVIWR